MINIVISLKGLQKISDGLYIRDGLYISDVLYIRDGLYINLLLPVTGKTGTR